MGTKGFKNDESQLILRAENALSGNDNTIKDCIKLSHKVTLNSPTEHDTTVWPSHSKKFLNFSRLESLANGFRWIERHEMSCGNNNDIYPALLYKDKSITFLVC